MSISIQSMIQSEVRVTDSLTGGQKGKKLESFDLLPSAALEEVARVYGRGAEKYAARNWEKGYDWGLSLAALERHLNKFKQGEQRDELENHHLACVVFHALALITFERYGLGTDTRSTLGQAQVAHSAPKRYQVPGTSSANYSFPVDGNGSLVDEEVSTQEMELNQKASNHSTCGCGMVFELEKK